MTLEERLKRKLKKQGQCLVWTGATTPEGYGLIARGGLPKKLVGTHRVAYELAFGSIPAKKVVRHKCDNPPCCNPDHLILGTQMDNRQDMLDRGRANPAKGEDQAKAILTEKQVLEIRQRYANGETNKTKLSKDYGISRRALTDVVNRKTWKHI